MFGGLWAILAVALALIAFALSPDQTVVLPLVAAIAGGIAALPTWLAFSYLTDAYGGRVAWLAATLKEHSVHSKGGYTYYLDVGSLKRRVSYSTFVSVPTGTQVRCYHAPGSGRILSLEFAAEPEPSGGQFAIPHPDAWNRLRTLEAIALVGILFGVVGVRELVGAHPTEPMQYSGVANYYVSHGSKGSVHYHLSVPGSSDYEFREPPFYLQPPIESPDAMTGQEVQMYVDSNQVIAVFESGTLHGDSDFLNPERERQRMQQVGGFLLVVGIVIGGVFLAAGRIRLIRRRAA